MSDLITKEIFTDGQKNINATNMNGIVSRATVQPDVIANKPETVTMNVSDYFLVLKTDNTLARSKFQTVVDSTSSSLPLADTTKNGTLRQVSGLASDFVGGDNQCHPLTSIIPTGTVWDTLATTAPTGWLLMQGQSLLRTDYPALFALIGTTYGSVDSTHFSLPDARGRGTIGAGTGPGLTARVLGAKGGVEKLVAGNLPLHAHSITDAQHSHATVAHTHADAGHTHPVAAQSGTIGVSGGASTINYLGPTTTGTGFASLATAAPNTDARFTGINTTQNAGSATPAESMSPYLVTNKMVKT